MLEDIAILTGGTAIGGETGIRLEGVRVEDLGRARRVTVDKENTTIVDGAGSYKAIEGRIKQLRGQIEATTSDYDREKLQERLAKIAGGVAVIRVGAATETEMKEKVTCVENALKLTRAAVEDGIVAGGGIALLRAGRTLRALASSAQPGAAIVMRACEEPLRQIAASAGLEEEGAVKSALGNANTCYGLNVVTGEWQDLVAAGIVDSAKVTCLALEVAAAEGVSFLTSETAAFEA